MVEQITHRLTYSKYDSIESLSDEDQKLVRKAQEAMDTAYAPYSNFQVGCAILLEDNEVVIGSNQENSAYPSGLCAERVALFHIGTTNKPIKTIAVATRKEINGRPIAPCGSCRQVMVEFANRQEGRIELIMYSGSSVLKFDNVLNLMPLSFGPDDLK